MSTDCRAGSCRTSHASGLRRGALAILLPLALLLLSDGETASAQSRRDPQIARSERAQTATVQSSMQLLGMKFEVTHERASGSPLPPDLSRAKEILIPRAARFRVALPVLWEEQVLSPGEYRLGIIVDEDLQLFLRLKPVRGGTPRRLPLELGNYNSPSDRGIVITLAAVQGDHNEVGSLMIRWGALLFQAEFRPVRQRTSKLDGLRLSSFEFPRLAITPRELPLGQLRGRRSGAGGVEQLFLLTGGASGPRLRFDDQQYLSLLDDRREMQQELARRERAGAEKAELRRLQARLAGVEARLKGLDPSATTREIPGTKVVGEASAAERDASGFDVRLEEFEDAPHLSVVVGGVRYRFAL